MSWTELVAIWSQVQPAVNLGLALLCLVLILEVGRGRRQARVLIAEAEQRLSQCLTGRTAELEGRFRGFIDAHQAQCDELGRQLREESARSGRIRAEHDPASRLDKKHQVLSLAQMGLAPRDISQKLRLPLGETELLLGIWENFNSGETLHGRSRLH